MSTLPRTRSVGAGSALNSAHSKDQRVRPVSVCDTSWARMSGHELRGQQQLVRTPSQANNLCTTVPQNLVAQTLGGRHTPTRTSLRHSRMVVLAKNGKPLRDRRWAPYSLGRAGVLVVTAQILVGVMGVTLGAWFLMWAPTLKFRDVPHYAGVAVFMAGVCGAILISCFQRRRYSTMASVVKGVLVALCCISVVTCLCVCIFTALHLTQLASMTCHAIHTSFDKPTTTPTPALSTTSSGLPARSGYAAPSSGYEAPSSGYEASTSRLPETSSGYATTPSGYEDDELSSYGLTGTTVDALHSPAGFEDDEDETEGSGGNRVIEELEFETGTLDAVTVSPDAEIVLNLTSCVCEKRGSMWRRRVTYANLTCIEVNNILPVLFVASCVVTGVGAILSALILYLLWSFKNSFYGSAKPHEMRPFIFTSNFKNNKASNGSSGSSTRVGNGDSKYR